MKIGQQVTYVDADGTVSSATILRLVDNGPSGGKILDLETKSGTELNVLAEADQKEGDGFWSLDARPERRASTRHEDDASDELEASDL